MEPLLDTEQVAALLGVETRTLDNWASLSKGPDYIKVGRRRKYDPADVRSWLESQKVRH